MLRVKVELVPFGDETKAKQIGEMVIANAGNHAKGADYKAWLAPDEWSKTPAVYSELYDYDRSQSVWTLIKLLLEASEEGHTPDPHPQSLAKRLFDRLAITKKS